MCTKLENIYILLVRSILFCETFLVYRCETQSVTLREEHRLRMFENRALRKIFEPKWADMTGGWRKVHNKEFHNVYSSKMLLGWSNQETSGGQGM
jgi:hypothetical protein